MSTEAVRLFDLALARRLLALDRIGLTAWLAAELPALKAVTRRGAASLLEELRRSLPPAEAAALPPLSVFEAHWDDLADALAAASDAAEVALARAALAEKAAFGEERVELDLPGGPAAVFGGRAPDGALFDRDLFAGDGPERYLLLLPAHAVRLAEALEARRGGDEAARRAAASRLRVLVLRCTREHGLRLAWLLEL
jgi:hypothetical protein